jgi:proteasome lid subunit RPN8/RPN11
MEAKVVIGETDYEAMLAHLQDVYPLEGCGLLAGKASIVSRLYRIENILASPYRYEMDPRQQLQAFQELENAGMELLAIYHSHPAGPEEPSVTDIARAYYPNAVQIIVSLRKRAEPSVRAFTIVDGRVDEVLLKVV